MHTVCELSIDIEKLRYTWAFYSISSQYIIQSKIAVSLEVEILQLTNLYINYFLSRLKMLSSCDSILSIWIMFGLLMKCHAISDILPTIMDEFRIYQPILLGDTLKMKEMIEVVKKLNYHSTKWNSSSMFEKRE